MLCPLKKGKGGRNGMNVLPNSTSEIVGSQPVKKGWNVVQKGKSVGEGGEETTHWRLSIAKVSGVAVLGSYKQWVRGLRGENGNGREVRLRGGLT